MALSGKRIFIEKDTNMTEREKLVKSAAENGCCTLVFSMNDRFFKTKNAAYCNLIKHYALNIEAGGQDLSLLLPRRLFLFHRNMFIMIQGKRKPNHHFCPTNPKTIAVISGRAKKIIERIMPKVTVPRIFHLLPDEGFENTWCACPACRAFRPAEQYLIAVNTVAAVLAKLDPDARLVYSDFDSESEADRIKPMWNMAAL
jgi:hypothetical protein